jgi:hypothetical protein
MLNFKKFMESAPTGTKRIAIIDFDDTLVHTPTPEQGIPDYEKTTGKPWMIKDKETAVQHGFDPKFRRTGWWGRPETLQFDRTPERLNQNVADALKSFHNDPQTHTVLMTGRHAALGNSVKDIMAHYGVHADEYYFKGQKDLTKDPAYPKSNDTFDYKAFVIIKRLMSPEIETVEIFDDRVDHVNKFLELGRNLKETWPNLKTVLVHDVRSKKNYSI